VKEHDAPLHDIEYVPYYEDITVEYEPGTTREVQMPDGSHIYLKKLAEDYDPTSRERAMTMIREARGEQKLITGLLYAEPGLKPFEDELNMVDAPLATLPLEQVRPPKSVLEAVMEQLKTGKGMTAPAGGG
jgi:2-oxoglutarate ferredoxin oxidoreductase subunit beta